MLLRTYRWRQRWYRGRTAATISRTSLLAASPGGLLRGKKSVKKQVRSLRASIEHRPTNALETIPRLINHSDQSVDNKYEDVPRGCYVLHHWIWVIPKISRVGIETRSVHPSSFSSDNDISINRCWKSCRIVRQKSELRLRSGWLLIRSDRINRLLTTAARKWFDRNSKLPLLITPRLELSKLPPPSRSSPSPSTLPLTSLGSSLFLFLLHLSAPFPCVAVSPSASFL